METKVIIFLESFCIEHATPENQLAYLEMEVMENHVGSKFGRVYGQRQFFGNDQRKVIQDIIKSDRPKWVIGMFDSATILLKIRLQRKILVNPTITFNDLNNVTEFDRRNTYGFFDADHEADYALFQKVYTNSAWYANTTRLRLSDIETEIKEIIENYGY